ncbi:MAG: hypothetical protein ACTJHU_09435 [Mycetocola sp.]
MTAQMHEAPEWFGSAATTIAFFPIMMSGYALFYAAWLPVAWGVNGAIALGAITIVAAILIVRGTVQIRHAARYPSRPTTVEKRQATQMGILNGITHPLWMVAAIVLIVTGNGRWALPVMVFVIGAHFIPIAPILGRRIDYLLGPLTMAFAVAAGVLATNPTVLWTVVAAVAGIGGTLSTLIYAAYLTFGYGALCRKAGISDQIGWLGPAHCDSVP